MKRIIILLLFLSSLSACSSPTAYPSQDLVAELESKLAEANRLLDGYKELASQLQTRLDTDPDRNERTELLKQVNSLKEQLKEKDDIIREYQYSASAPSSGSQATDQSPAETVSSIPTNGPKALKIAVDILSEHPLSEKTLRDWLLGYNFTKSEMDYAVANCGADWKQNAVKRAEDLEPEYVFDFLQTVYDFTYEEALYASKNFTPKINTVPTQLPSATPTTGEKNALSRAKQYLDLMSGFSEEKLYEQLKFEGYSSTEAQYAVQNCNADWNEQAALRAKAYMDISSFSRSKLIEQLEFEGFTHSQAVYGASSVGY